MSGHKHIDDVARELRFMEEISLKALIKMGLNIIDARNVVRLSRLLKNILDLWYRDKVYRGEARSFLGRNISENRRG